MRGCSSLKKILPESNYIKNAVSSKGGIVRSFAMGANQHWQQWQANTESREDSKLQMAKPFKEIPSLPMLPIIGNAWVYMPIIGRYSLSKLHLATRHKRQLLGDIYRERFGSFNMVMTFRPEDMEAVFQKEGPYPSRSVLTSLQAYRESRKQWYKSTGLLILQGKEWHDLRSKTQKHLLKPKAIIAYLDPMQDVAKDFIQRIYGKRDANKEVPNLLGELYKWALESVAFVGLDTRLGCLQSTLPPESDAMKMICSVQTQFECMIKLEAFSGNIQFWKYFNTPTWKRFTHAGDVFTEIAFKYINRALENMKRNEGNEEKELTLLQVMLATKGLDSSGAMVTVADMLLAGIDTTSHLIGFLLYHLARNPEKQELLYQEIYKLLPTENERISPAVFSEMKYLKACVKESLRLTPIAGGTTRLLEHDVVLSGYRVPAGTLICVGHQEMCTDEEHFSNALSFIPERWLDKDQKSHPLTSLPFGFGTRSCIGRRLAELETTCLMMEIIRNFRVEYHLEDIGITTSFINMPDKPLRFNFIER